MCATSVMLDSCDVMDCSPPGSSAHEIFQQEYWNTELPLCTYQFSSVAQSCLTLCDPMDCSTPGFPVLPYLQEFAQFHVRWESVMLSNHLIHCCPLLLCLQSFPESRSFPMSQLFASDGQSIGVSASASVLPMNTQGWSPLGWTGWISLQSKGLSRVFSNTRVQKHPFFSAQLSL